jgi:hypothetical protein
MLFSADLQKKVQSAGKEEALDGCVGDSVREGRRAPAFAFNHPSTDAGIFSRSLILRKFVSGGRKVDSLKFGGLFFVYSCI